MLAERLGVPRSIAGAPRLPHGALGRQGPAAPRKGEEIPLPMRIVHVASDAAFQRMLGGEEQAVRLVRERAGHALRPRDRRPSGRQRGEILALDEGDSAWEEVSPVSRARG